MCRAIYCNNMQFSDAAAAPPADAAAPPAPEAAAAAPPAEGGSC